MGSVLFNILAFVVAVGVLVAIHEFGHFWVARRCGVKVLAPGCLELDKSPYVQNSFGTVNGGVQALVAEAAAVSLTDGSHAIGQQIHYLEQVGAGPVRVEAEIMRTGPAPLCEVRLVDTGDDRLVAVADVTVATD